MIVKDESHCIARCLKSVSKIVSEIIIVDTGSTDNTPDIARSFGARVIHHVWHDDFSEARNVSLEHAQADWILVLDADEELTASARKHIRKLTSDSLNDGYLFIVRHLAPDNEISKYSEMRLLRLFKNRSEFRYHGKIHEQILPSVKDAGNRIKATNLIIKHYGYMDETCQSGDVRAKRNLKILKNILQVSPKDPYIHYHLGMTYRTLGDNEKSYKSLQKAIAHDADSQLNSEILSKLYIALAQLSLGSNQFKAAIDYANISFEYGPDNLIGLYVTGISMIYVQKYSEATPYLVQVLNHPQLRLKEKKYLKKVITFCKHKTSEK